MRESRQSVITGYHRISQDINIKFMCINSDLVHIFKDNKLPVTICIVYLLCTHIHISFTSGVTQECLKENQFISCALLERKYVLEAVQYVNCTTLLANQKRVLSMTLDLKRPFSLIDSTIL